MLNPGSIDQPRAGEPRAGYALWENGAFRLRTFSHPVEDIVAKLKALAFPPGIENKLSTILRMGAVKT